MSDSVTNWTVDGETARHHPVVGDELFEQFGDGRTRPGDPALVCPGSGAAARGQQRAVVQLAHEVVRALAVLSGSSI